MAKLTKRLVDRIAPGASDIVVWDDRLPGFGLQMKPLGVRSYIVQYRNAQGRSRRLTISRHGILTVDEARQQARQTLAGTKRGEDPAADRTDAREAPTVEELCDRYLSEHVAAHNKPSTAKECRRIVKRYIKPALGTLKAASVARRDVMKLHRSMSASPRQANHVLSVLSKVFSLAELWGVRANLSNPCRHPVPPAAGAIAGVFFRVHRLRRLKPAGNLAGNAALPAPARKCDLVACIS